MNKYKVSVNGIPYEVEIEAMGATNQTSIATKPVSTATNYVAPTPVAQPVHTATVQPQVAAPTTTSGEGVLAPMQGKIVSVAVSTGQSVKSGQVLAVLEAMKMENEIMADCDGQVLDVHVKAGQSVEANDVLVTLA